MKAGFHAKISITTQRPVHFQAKCPVSKACFINFVFRFSGHFESDLSHSAAEREPDWAADLVPDMAAERDPDRAAELDPDMAAELVSDWAADLGSTPAFE